MNAYAKQAYLETRILQADPIELIRLLYRGALAACANARDALRCGDIKGRSRHITHAGEILSELTSSVDIEKGGELSVNLLRLYDYMQLELANANFRQSEEPLLAVEKLLGTLLEAWEGIEVEKPMARADASAFIPADDAGTYPTRSLTF